MTTLEKEWVIYRDACYPPLSPDGPLSAIQERETRQAFFAGCFLILNVAINGPMAEGPRVLAAWMKEAETFHMANMDELERRRTIKKELTKFRRNG
jgi:hypothetical protein